MTLDGRKGQFIRAGAIALGDMIKESAFQKLCFAMGIANKQEGLRGRDKIEFVRKIMHTNFVGEISDKYCELGDKVYKGLLTDRGFTDEDFQKALQAVKEEPSPSFVTIKKKSDKKN